VDRNTRYKALIRILESFGLEVRDGKGSEKIRRSSVILTGPRGSTASLTTAATPRCRAR